jgi:membrane protein DedA with SNARE-associated domain
MVDWILGQPFAVAMALLTLVACFRSQCTYWLGRGIRAGVVKAKWAQRLVEGKAQLATAKLEKWGWPIIPASFLTVGFQTAVHLTAGLLGWRWPRYTLAASIGWLAWGAIYAAGGLGVFMAAAAIFQRSPILAVAFVKLIAVAIIAICWWRSKKLTFDNLLSR